MTGKLVEEFTVAHPRRTIRHLRSGDGQVHADAHHLIQLLANLLGNALTYGDPFGTVTIISEVDRGVAQLALHNAGPPIPESALATMFEPMVRGDSDSSSRSVGLGLFIGVAIAKAHGGDVSVTSASETGTRFTLTFPIAVRAA